MAEAMLQTRIVQRASIAKAIQYLVYGYIEFAPIKNHIAFSNSVFAVSSAWMKSEVFRREVLQKTGDGSTAKGRLAPLPSVHSNDGDQYLHAIQYFNHIFWTAFG